MKLLGLPVLRHSDKVDAVNLCIKGKNGSKNIGGSSLSVSRVASSVRIDTTRTYNITTCGHYKFNFEPLFV